MGLELTYWKNIDGYLEVVELIKNGEFSEAGNLWVLPVEYSYLSDGGEIVFKEHQDGFCIMFYTFRGLGISGSNGFIYCTEGLTLARCDIGFEIEDMTKKDDNWYWAASY